jgi:hypothetical protein
MKPRLTPPSPAFVISLIALILALGGGAAAYASGLISGSQIKNRSIAESKLTKAAVKSLRGQPGPTGNAYSVQRPSFVALPGPWAYGTVTSLPLAAGSYILMAKTHLHASGDNGGTCRLLDSRAGTVDVSSAAGSDAIVSLLAPLVTSGSKVELQCQATLSGSNQGLGQSAGFTRLVAIKVGSVKGS